MVELFDTHAHLDAEQFQPDLPQVLLRAQSAGVTRILTVGITLASSRQACTLAEQHTGVFCAVGIHPNEITSAQPNDWEEIILLAANPRVVAIGETGLDRYWDKTPFEVQQDWFFRHLQLAHERRLPIIIHCRDAESDVLRLLQEFHSRHGPIRGVMHSFSGSMQTAQACLEMGLFLSFAGMLTYKNAANLREIAAQVPRDRLLVETDCPYLAPVPFRGKRNEPAHVLHTATTLAELHGCTLEALAAQTTANAQQLFLRSSG